MTNPDVTIQMLQSYISILGIFGPKLMPLFAGSFDPGAEMAGDAARSSDLEEGEMAEDSATGTSAALMERPVLTPGITSALVRLFEHHEMPAPSQLTMT